MVARCETRRGSPALTRKTRLARTSATFGARPASLLTKTIEWFTEEERTLSVYHTCVDGPADDEVRPRLQRRCRRTDRTCAEGPATRHRPSTLDGWMNEFCTCSLLIDVTPVTGRELSSVAVRTWHVCPVTLGGEGCLQRPGGKFDTLTQNRLLKFQ